MEDGKILALIPARKGVSPLRNDERLLHVSRPAQFLGESRDTRAVEPLIQTLDQNDNELTAEAVIALGLLAMQARDPLKQLRNSTTDPRVQDAANYALIKLGEQQAPPAPHLKELAEHGYDVHVQYWGNVDLIL